MDSANAQLRRPEDILADAFDEKRAILICGKHNYVAGSKHQKPRMGCPDCVKVTYIHLIATRGGDIKENLDQLEAIIHGLVELDQEGKMDFQITRPTIEIEKDAA